ncbi:MAG: hypothetical protein WB623_12795 [Candidatus Sulfotelmatobacter sp.]
MKHKWLELAPWHHKQEGLSVSGDVSSEASGGGNRNCKGHDEKLARHVSLSKEKSPADATKSVASVQVGLLLPMEDIYSAAGITSPRKGYGINKVVNMLVNMLHSEHIRGLSTEMKRGAVRMALDAAGVAIDQIQQDAKARQDALDSYEIEQRKQVEAEWARKAEENIQIQADLERVKAHYMAHHPQPGWRSAGESRVRRLAVDEKAGNREHVRSRGAVFEIAGPGASPFFAGGRCHSGRGPKAGVIPLPTEL